MPRTTDTDGSDDPSSRWAAARSRWPAAAVCAALAVAGCGGPGEPDVVVIGDSIVHGVEDLARQEMGDAFDLEVIAKPGDTTGDALGKLDQVDSGDPRAVIIDLGTNDALGRVSIDDAASNLGQLVGHFPEAPCVALTTVYERMPTRFDPAVREDAAALNVAIRELAESDERIRVIDWNAIVTSSDEALLADDIHPNDRGAEVLVREFAGFLDRCEPDANDRDG